MTDPYWYPGNFVGGPEVFGTGMHVWSGVATGPTTVVLLPGQHLKTLAQQIPALAIGLINGLVFKGKAYSALAQMLGTRSVTQRLAHLLLHLVDTYGIADAKGVMIGARFSHADLANMVGATRQWVTTSIKRLQTEEVLAVKLGHIVVCRPDVLEAARQDEG